MQDIPNDMDHTKTKKKTLRNFSDRKKKEIIDFGIEKNSWKVAGKMHGISAKKVGLWAKTAGKKLKFFYDKVDQKKKDKILKWGLKENSWRQAARKFAVPHTAVSFWAKQAGYKLTFLRKKKCDVCDIPLEDDESMDEHIAVYHITVEGCCNVCGNNTEDVVNHFYDHMVTK